MTEALLLLDPLPLRLGTREVRSAEAPRVTERETLRVPDAAPLRVSVE